MIAVDLAFERWSVYGNELLFLDALTSPLPPEQDLPALAERSLAATGCDSMILVQSCTKASLAAINDAWSYWETPPSSVPDIMVRIFEPDGSESLSCGNGLLSSASLLLERGIPLPALALTGLPDPLPWTVEVGTDRSGRAWLKSDRPRRVPVSLAVSDNRTPICSSLDRFMGIAPAASAGDEEPPFPQNLAGYLVLTGEPHLVVLAKEWDGEVPDDRDDRGRWLDRLGLHLNKGARALFPKGVNIDLVLSGSAQDGVSYRCFERGVNRETGACGTGALAVAHAWRELACESCETIKVRPFGAEDDGYLVRWTDGGIHLCGMPRSMGRVSL